MGDAVRTSPGSTLELSQLLLDGKTDRPEPRPAAVSRDQLIRRARASEARVVAVSAPAGYGKSTLLAEWGGAENRAVAWASLDRLDDDPAALLILIAAAMGSISPHVAELVPEMRGVGVPVLGRSAPRLAAAIRATEAPFVLFLDDVHLAASPACHDVLEVILDGIPRGSQLVIAGRHEQPYFARLRARGEGFEIGAAELRLDVDGARSIFDRARVDISPDALAAVVERCEGWPTGIFLCSLIELDGDEEPVVTGDDRFVADYLYRECVRRLPERLQLFLRRTAVLDQLSAAACDALLESNDSAGLLREVEALNLFLIPLDHRRGWFRYHALFRDFLLAELRLNEVDEIVGLHRRAADWFEGNALPAQAIEHLLAAGEVERAGLLVAELALPTYQDGRVAVLGRWMSALGEEIVDGFPPLLILRTWMAILLGHVAHAERLAARLEKLDWIDGSAEDRLMLDSSRAMIRAAMCAQGPEAAAADASFALESEPSWSMWRDQALHLHGTMRFLLGDFEGARRAFAEASTVAAAAGNVDSVLLSEADLALLAVEAGDWRTAERHSDAALDAIDAGHMEGYSTTGVALGVAARIALRRGETAKAERLLARGMRARVPSTYVLPIVAVQARLQLAKAFAESGDRVAAMHLMRELEELTSKRPRLGILIDEMTALRRRLELMSGRDGAIPLTPAELRLLPYLQTHLTISEIGKRLFITRNTVSSEVGSIYRKLDVSTRSAAVERATELGLLGE